MNLVLNIVVDISINQFELVDEQTSTTIMAKNSLHRQTNAYQPQQ